MEGIPAKILRMCLQKEFDLAISPKVIDEYNDNSLMKPTENSTIWQKRQTLI